jgi:hypothetical protein
MLKQTPTQIAANAEGATALVEKVLARVREKAGSAAKQVNIFQNLGMFIVEAAPGFLRELVAQPEIRSAMANRQPDESMAPPPVTTPSAKARTPQKAGSSTQGARRGKPRSAPEKPRK